MNSILDFLNKWGIMISLLLTLSITQSTCGVKSKIDTLNKKVVSIETEIHFNDSIQREKTLVQNEIQILETARLVVYDNNTVVRSVNRPDDIMNNYDQRIKKLKEQLDRLNNASRK